MGKDHPTGLKGLLQLEAGMEQAYNWLVLRPWAGQPSVPQSHPAVKGGGYIFPYAPPYMFTPVPKNKKSLER